MKKILVTVNLLYYGLASVISCTSRFDNTANEKGLDSIDSAYVLAIEEQMEICDTPYKSVDVIVIKDATNDDDYSMSFFSQEDTKGRVLSGGKPVKNSQGIFLPYSQPTNKLTQEALDYLAEYIDKNCECKNPIGLDDTVIWGGYVFKLIQDNRTKTCYVFSPDKEIILDYLKGLTTWLEGSTYKHEFRKLIEYIN